MNRIYNPYLLVFFKSGNMTSSIMANISTDVVVLSKLTSDDQWYEDTKALIASQMWKYFKPDSNITLTELMKPVMPLDDPSLDVNKPFQIRNACITSNYRYEDVSFKHFQVFKKNKRKRDKYHEFDVKLREYIQSTVGP